MSSTSRYRLTMRKGPLPGKVYDLAKSLLIIGREVKGDIVINDAEVSRQHLRLTEQAGGGYVVEDLASTNGSFINGQRLSGPTVLRPGDILGLGGTVELEYGQQRDPNATVMTAQSAPPAGEPVQPVAAYTPPPPAPAYAAPLPSAPAAGGFQPQPWMWAVGIGCGVLALCGCLAGAVALLLPQIQQMLR